MYADDSKISPIINDLDDCKTLQADLDHLHAWSSTWGMRFNISKSKIMSITRTSNVILYAYNGTVLEILILG